MARQKEKFEKLFSLFVLKNFKLFCNIACDAFCNIYLDVAGILETFGNKVSDINVMRFEKKLPVERVEYLTSIWYDCLMSLAWWVIYS